MMGRILLVILSFFGYVASSYSNGSRNSSNQTCLNGFCGRGSSTSIISSDSSPVEYELSVEDALRLSNAQSVDEWLAIFDKQGIFLDDVMPTGNFGPEPAGQNIMQAPPPRYPGYSSKLLSERRGPAVGVPLQQMPTTHFGRHSGIQFAMNAGCAPEKVAVPIQVPDGALESRHYHIVPTCTRIERCGGCCNHELLSCQATAKEIMTMNILAIPLATSINPKPLKIAVEVEKHINCSCDCITKASDCSHYQEHKDCKCVCKDTDYEATCLADPNRIWNTKTCHCACKHPKPCASGHFFHPVHCRCEEMQFDENNNFVYSSYRNRGQLPLPPGPSTEPLIVEMSTAASAQEKTTIGRFWLKKSQSVRGEDSTSAPSSTTTLPPIPSTTTTRSSKSTQSWFFDNPARATHPPSRTRFQVDPARIRPRLDDDLDTEDEKDQTFSRSKQVTSVNVPRLKKWKQLATASESISSNGHTHNGNALDTSTFDYKSEDEKGGESYDANSGANPRTTNRKSRVFDPNEKDRILNNMAAFKKGTRRQK